MHVLWSAGPRRHICRGRELAASSPVSEQLAEEWLFVPVELGIGTGMTQFILVCI